MRMALQEANQALAEGEIPIGAVVVARGRIIARAHNLTETLHDVTAHAEIKPSRRRQTCSAANISPIARYMSPWNPASCAPAP